MSLKEIYTNAIESVIKKEMSIKDLWEVFEEHLSIKQNKNNKLSEHLEEVIDKYNNLLELTANAYKEHKKLSKE